MWGGGSGSLLDKGMRFFVMLVAKPHNIERTAVVRVMPLGFAAAIRDGAHGPWDHAAIAHGIAKRYMGGATFWRL